MFGISRGFQRLAVVATIPGFLLSLSFIAINFDVPDPMSWLDMATVVLVLTVAPAIVVLLIGWVVAGFRQAN
jgi:hypothetical protein